MSVIAKINCRNAATDPESGQIACGIGLFAGKPTRANCAGCQARVPIEQGKGVVIQLTVSAQPKHQTGKLIDNPGDGSIRGEAYRPQAKKDFTPQQLLRMRLAWRDFHTKSKNLTDATRAEYKLWVEHIFPVLIPCGSCARDWLILYAENPMPESPADIEEWAIDMHNRVNVQLGKAVFVRK